MADRPYPDLNPKSRPTEGPPGSAFMETVLMLRDELYNERAYGPFEVKYDRATLDPYMHQNYCSGPWWLGSVIERLFRIEGVKSVKPIDTLRDWEVTIEGDLESPLSLLTAPPPIAVSVGPIVKRMSVSNLKRPWTDKEALIRGTRLNPQDEGAWAALADYLLDQGDQQGYDDAMWAMKRVKEGWMKKGWMDADKALMQMSREQLRRWAQTIPIPIYFPSGIVRETID